MPQITTNFEGMGMRRTRKIGTKSRSGCRTCKIRHVKCDEAHPSCTRCSMTGRVCLGYQNQTQFIANTTSSATAPSYSSNSNTKIPQMNVRPPRSEPTNRTLDYFLTHASLALTGFNHRSGFWTGLVPMLCETEDAVLRAVL
ncbi:hypothetical protein IFR05_007295, partial [Cadophora sp. M221]